MLNKLLKHLTNVAVALAFLLVDAPAAPVAKMLPSSGVAMAVAPPTDIPGPVCSAPYSGYGSSSDIDCDGMPDYVDPCPFDPNPACGVNGEDGSSWWRGYLDGDIGGQASWNCQVKFVLGIKLAVCNDYDGDGDREGAFCLIWEQGGLGIHLGVSCPDDPD